MERSRLRSGWRLLLFLLLFAAAFIAAAGVFVLVDPRGAAAVLLGQGLVVLVAALAAGWLLLALVDGRRPGALGFAWTSATAREIGLGLAVGGGCLALVVAVLWFTGMVAFEATRGTPADFATALAMHFGVFAVAAAGEEALFRGYAFQVLVEAVGAMAATVVVSAAFAAAHLANPHVGWLALGNIFLAGILFSVAYLRTRSLWFATAVHLGWNWTMASVLALPVSGLDLLETPLYRGVPTGPVMVTGGAFGPEGGIAATVAFGLALWIVVRWPGLEPAPELMRLHPLVNRRLGDGGGEGQR